MSRSIHNPSSRHRSHAPIFAALGDETRLALLAKLGNGQQRSISQLAEGSAVTRQAITKHLTLMADTGLVTPEPGERRRIRYRLRSAPVQLAQQFLAALANDWDDRLDALKHHLTAG